MSNRRTAVAIFLLVCGLAAAVNAEDPLYKTPAGEADRKAIEVILSRMTDNPVMRGRFSQQKDIKSLSRSFKGNGTFIIARDDGIIWDTLKPFPSTMIISGDQIIQTIPGGKKTVMKVGDNPVFKEFGDTIRSVFSGDTNQLFSKFNVYFLKGESGIWRIGLVPKDSAVRSVISTMEISGSQIMNRFLLTEVSSDTVSYDFSGQTFSKELTIEEKNRYN